MANDDNDYEDDLDAFFDQVSAVEAELVDIDKPPNKKQKTIRPKGIVVASSGYTTIPDKTVAATATANAAIETTIHDEALPKTHSTASYIPPVSIIPLPVSIPPPPPQQQQQQAQIVQVHKRSAAGQVWNDATLTDWPENDYRIFVGNLSKDVTDPELYAHFSQYKSLAMVKIVKDQKTGLSKGFGFCSLLDPLECAKAIREMDQTWLSSRPIRTKRSDWKERELKEVQKKKLKKKKQGNRYM